jgi:hypothetical protein
MKTYLAATVAMLSLVGYSQERFPYIEEPIEISSPSKANENTLMKSERSNDLSIKNIEFEDFQFVLDANGIRPVVTKEIILFVESNRSVTEDVTLQYSQDIRVFIPSKQTLNSPNYQKLPMYREVNLGQ